MYSFNYLLSDINNIKGIGSKTAKLFKKKNKSNNRIKDSFILKKFCEYKS